MANHTISEKNPLYVTGADQYRTPFTLLLTPTHPRFEELQEFILPEHRRSEGYGMVFLESEEHSATYIGTIQQVKEYVASSATTSLDASQGVCYGFWPQGDAWKEAVPDNTWNPGGEGIVTEFVHPKGGRVTVYEFLGAWTEDAPKRPLVTFHCTVCHHNTLYDSGKVHESTGPDRRRWAARNARQHIRSVDSSHSECRITSPRFAEVVTAVANEMHGTNSPVVTWESRCSTEGPCAQIRHLRVRS